MTVLFCTLTVKTHTTATEYIPVLAMHNQVLTVVAGFFICHVRIFNCKIINL